MGKDETPSQGPIENAKDLAKLASRVRDPRAKLWYLEWAMAFEKLAAFGAKRGRKDGEDPPETPE